MDAYIKKIYDMLYSSIISPYNLLENAKPDNYSYVNYYSNKVGLAAEMQCVIPGEGERIFVNMKSISVYVPKCSLHKIGSGEHEALRKIFSFLSSGNF